jgi:hypothetical protein
MRLVLIFVAGNRKKCEEILEGKRHVIVTELHKKPVLGSGPLATGICRSDEAIPVFFIM